MFSPGDIDRIWSLNNKTLNLMSETRFEEAVEVASESIRALFALLQDTQKQLVNCFHQKIKANVKLNKFYRAHQDIESIEHMIKDVSQDAEGHYLQAVIYEGMNNINGAMDELKKAIKINNHEEAKKKLKKMNENPLFHLRPYSGYLTDELWVNIFKMLDLKIRIKIEQVSSNWQSLSVMSWNDVRTLPHSSMMNANKQIDAILPACFVGLLIRCGRFCNDIDLSCVDVSRVRLEGVGRFRQRNKLRWLLQTISIYCPNLHALTVPDAAFVDEDLEFVFSRFPKLTALKLVPIVQTPEGRLTGNAMRHLPASMKFLSIQMSSSSAPMNDNSLFLLADRCPNLELLEFFSKGDSFFNAPAVEYMTAHLSKLKKLKLGCVGEGSSSLTCQALMPIATMSQLRELCLWVPTLDDQFAGALVSGCEYLSSLELHADTASAEALLKLAAFKNIKDLRLDLSPGLPWNQFLHEFSKEGGAILEILALSKMSPSNFNLALKQFPKVGEICLWNSFSIDSTNLLDVLLQNSERTTKVKITASCYYVQLTPQLMQILHAFPLFTLACYFDHTPCDLCSANVICTYPE